MAAGMGAADDGEVPETPLNLEAVIGFNGRVPSGLVFHPDGKHIIFPLGSTVVIKNIVDNTQCFLQGHTDRVTCVAVSHDGSLVASGQVTALGLRAPVIVWDFEAALRNGNTVVSEGEKVHELILHKGRIQALDFNPSGKFLASLGGADDNSLVVWDLEAGAAVCGAPAASHATHCVKWYHGSETELITAGQYSVRKWDLDLSRRRLFPTDFNLGSIRRVVDCIAVRADDGLAWCGSQSGDVLEISLRTLRFTRASKVRFPQGVRSLLHLGGRSEMLVAGAGNGALVELELGALGVARARELLGGITSLSPAPDGSCFFAGTWDGNRYLVDRDSFEPALRGTSHPDPVKAITFPRGSEALFLTASKGSLRLWDAKERVELLRINVPGLECHAVRVSPSGDAIASAWEDGKVRVFGPESGRLQWVIPDAHADGVTALAYTNAGDRLITGGADGRVRVWDLTTGSRRMLFSFKEHKKAVTSIDVAADDSECVSAGADGSCVLWNLRKGARANALFASTVFHAVRYFPDESQLITAGTDRKLGYWDTSDCSPIRMLEGSTAALHAVDLTADGRVFAAAGADRAVRVWLYDEGVPLATGKGHSGAISSVAVAPGGGVVVSVGEEGGIFIWSMPSADAVDRAADIVAGTVEAVEGEAKDSA